jgi:hypothetical protein
VQALQESSYPFQDVLGRAWVLGEPLNGRKGMIHQGVGDILHQGCQLPSLSNASYLSIAQAFPELDQL